MKRDVNRFVLVLGIVFILSGLNLIYLGSFSQSIEYLTVALINLALGTILMISYKSPKLQKYLTPNI